MTWLDFCVEDTDMQKLWYTGEVGCVETSLTTLLPPHPPHWRSSCFACGSQLLLTITQTFLLEKLKVNLIQLRLHFDPFTYNPVIKWQICQLQCSIKLIVCHVYWAIFIMLVLVMLVFCYCCCFIAIFYLYTYLPSMVLLYLWFRKSFNCSVHYSILWH